MISFVALVGHAARRETMTDPGHFDGVPGSIVADPISPGTAETDERRSGNLRET